MGDLAQHFGKNVARKSPTIFIGHGHDPQWRELKDHLREKHHFEVETYETHARAGLSITEVLTSAITSTGIALLVLTGEDVDSTGETHARRNVIHELGLFQGRLGFTRAIALIEEGCSEFSNIAGLQHIPFSKGKIKEAFGEVIATIEREIRSMAAETHPVGEVANHQDDKIASQSRTATPSEEDEAIQEIKHQAIEIAHEIRIKISDYSSLSLGGNKSGSTYLYFKGVLLEQVIKTRQSLAKLGQISQRLDLLIHRTQTEGFNKPYAGIVLSLDEIYEVSDLILDLANNISQGLIKRQRVKHEAESLVFQLRKDMKDRVMSFNPNVRASKEDFIWFRFSRVFLAPVIHIQHALDGLNLRDHQLNVLLAPLQDYTANSVQFKAVLSLEQIYEVADRIFALQKQLPDDAKSGLPSITHDAVEGDCPGVLVVQTRGDDADIVCSECKGVIETVPADQVKEKLREIGRQLGTKL